MDEQLFRMGHSARADSCAASHENEELERLDRLVLPMQSMMQRVGGLLGRLQSLMDLLSRVDGFPADAGDSFQPHNDFAAPTNNSGYGPRAAPAPAQGVQSHAVAELLATLRGSGIESELSNQPQQAGPCQTQVGGSQGVFQLGGQPSYSRLSSNTGTQRPVMPVVPERMQVPESQASLPESHTLPSMPNRSSADTQIPASLMHLMYAGLQPMAGQVSQQTESADINPSTARPNPDLIMAMRRMQVSAQDMGLAPPSTFSDPHNMAALRHGVAEPVLSQADTGKDSTEDGSSPAEEDPTFSGDNLPSLGSSAHFMQQCKPCLFWYQGLCLKGERCHFCHIRHELADVKKVRPSKATRKLLRELTQRSER